ncbi:hypothetical protein E4634_15030 [Mangrovimicrobium sediminis]|uniref:TPM domain-containing protein n=1 Tax=Mangrovimicrobium sediminis TaxID=2562682 RepID=A0A4Z0LYS5_9GAMM|nr:TPM domain-containing protein [Haliea sp. SAOS-164]TGD72278.1 hypothetical protein E4634_15030 [Haliea sp. SAOS-164]
MHRVIANLCTTRRSLRRAFGEHTLDAIEAAIKASEREHSGELRFAVETALDLPALLGGVSARQRAVEAFASLHTWDTEANNGVLIYLLLAERDIEIVADRGYNGLVSAQQWEAVCREMEAAFARSEFEAGALLGIRRISALIAEHFPPRDDDRDELPNRPTLL